MRKQTMYTYFQFSHIVVSIPSKSHFVNSVIFSLMSVSNEYIFLSAFGVNVAL